MNASNNDCWVRSLQRYPTFSNVLYLLYLVYPLNCLRRSPMLTAYSTSSTLSNGLPTLSNFLDLGPY